jgi:hypothetical protein
MIFKAAEVAQSHLNTYIEEEMAMELKPVAPAPPAEQGIS